MDRPDQMELTMMELVQMELNVIHLYLTKIVMMPPLTTPKLCVTPT